MARENDRSHSNGFGIDAWVFIAMFVGYGMVYHDTPAVVSIFFVFLLVYLFADQFLARRYEEMTKFFVLTLVIGLFIVGATVGAILLRRASAPHQFVHDGLIQTEQATQFLLSGRNPYLEDYTQTPMAQWHFEIEGVAINPALYHNPYLPFFFLFTAPFFLLSNALLGWFDGRIIFLPMFVAVMGMLAQWVTNRPKKYALLFFVALNPFFTPYLIEGRNDVFVLFWLVLGVHLLRRKYEWLSSVAIGLACASKLTAWFLIPFYTIYLLRPEATIFKTWLGLHTIRRACRLLPLALVVALIIVPFFVWDPATFIDDVWNYQNGTSQFAPYPIHGYGFNILIKQVGLIPLGAVRSPSEVLQWIIGLPLLGLLMWRQHTHDTLSQMWLGYAFLIAVIAFFSHSLNDSHIGFILTLFVIGILTNEDVRSLSEVTQHD
ncbi:MAG: DUF2029 domain-containing protein [Chloroflexi bacterium]|nr:DUF2029 domain-containing protein [Chloroflexota bacterium]